MSAPSATKRQGMGNERKDGKGKNMTTNEILKEIHAALVEKAAQRIAIEGKAKVAAEIGNAIIDYGKLWTKGLSNDGKLSGDETEKITGKFDALIDEHVPAYSGSGVGIAWNGLSFFGLGWKGLKHYLAKWFKLDLK